MLSLLVGYGGDEVFYYNLFSILMNIILPKRIETLGDSKIYLDEINVALSETPLQVYVIKPFRSLAR